MTRKQPAKPTRSSDTKRGERDRDARADREAAETRFPQSASPQSEAELAAAALEPEPPEDRHTEVHPDDVDAQG